MSSEYYELRTMKEIMQRSRDLLAVAKQLHSENSVTCTISDCVAVVLGAIRDINAEDITTEIENVSDSIDWIRKQMDR